MDRPVGRALKDWASLIIIPIVAGAGAVALAREFETRNQRNDRPSQGARNPVLRGYSPRHADEAGSASGTDDPTVGTRSRRYKYTALGGDNRIRVIRLHPDPDPEAPLRCSLLVMDIPRSGQLNIEAISYWWGPEKPKKKLYPTNDTYLTIRPNLHAALKRFRRRTEDRFLWADAVCINQENEYEKSNQVRHMADIYSAARCTLIWLGESDSGANCLEFFNRLDALSIGNQNSATGKNRVSETVRYCFGDKSYEPLTQFFHDRKWFMRRWIIQEVAQSHDAVIHCSASKTSWKNFAAGVNILIKHPPRGVHTSDINVRVLETIQNINVLWIIRNQSFGILDLLTVFHSSRCEWARDRIFALLNLTDAKTEPNYSKKRDEEDIFISFAQDCLESEDHLGLLHCGPAFQPLAASARESWPSWVPDWRQKPSFNSLLNLGNFCASGNSTQKVEIISDSLDLLVTGCVFDEHSISVVPIMSPIPDDLERVHSWIEEWMPDFSAWPEKPPWREFAHTLVAGICHDLSLESRRDSFAPTCDEKETARRMAVHLSGFFMLSQYSMKMNRLIPENKRLPYLERVKYSSAARKYAQLVRTMMKGRCFFEGDVSNDAYMGVGPANMENGDIIVIFRGSRTPFVVRQIPGLNCFRLIGDCYIHKIMYGEAWTMALEEYDFRLI